MVNGKDVFTKIDRAKLLATFGPCSDGESASIHSVQLMQAANVQMQAYDKRGLEDGLRNVPGFSISTVWVGEEGFKDTAWAVGAWQALKNLQNSGADVHVGAALAILGTVLEDEHEEFVI